MKLFVETRGNFMLTHGAEVAHHQRPSVVSPNNFFQGRIALGQLKLLGNLTDEATDAAFEKYVEESKSTALATAAFLDKYELKELTTKDGSTAQRKEELQPLEDGHEPSPFPVPGPNADPKPAPVAGADQEGDPTPEGGSGNEGGPAPDVNPPAPTSDNNPPPSTDSNPPPSTDNNPPPSTDSNPPAPKPKGNGNGKGQK